MKKRILIAALIAGLFVSGCGSDDKKAEAPQQEKASVAHEVAEKSHQVVEEVGEVSGEVVDETVDMAGTVSEMVTEKAVEVKAAAVEMAGVVQEKAADVVEMANETASSLVDKTEEKVDAVAAVFAGTVASPDTVVIANNKGNVTFPHKIHGEKHGCQTCHGDVQPGPLTLGKDAAHALCKGCHTEKVSGPTKCSDCHEKKPKAVEGC